MILKPFSVPTREVPAVTTPLLQSIGRVGGLMTTLLLLPLGLLTVFINRRRIRSLRAQVLATVARTSLLGTQLAVLETQLTTAPNGDNHMVTQGAVAYATPQPSGAPFGSRAESERSRRPGARVAVGLALIATTAVYLALDSTRTEQPTDPAAPPTAAVAVLNAGSVPEAAHHLALDLLRHRVHVVGITNLAAAAPAEYEVLYTPGDARQARLLAGILKEQHPLVAPTDLNTTQAAGAEPRLIVVIP